MSVSIITLNPQHTIKCIYFVKYICIDVYIHAHVDVYLCVYLCLGNILKCLGPNSDFCVQALGIILYSIGRVSFFTVLEEYHFFTVLEEHHFSTYIFVY